MIANSPAESAFQEEKAKTRLLCSLPRSEDSLVITAQIKMKRRSSATRGNSACVGNHSSALLTPPSSKAAFDDLREAGAAGGITVKAP